MLLQNAIREFGGMRLATLCGVTPQAVSYWRRTGRVPPARAYTVAKLLGLPAHEVCPDVFPPPTERQVAV
jgi:DNA-binding transcriptional regulator YdaS (Cro superfamily)